MTTHTHPEPIRVPVTHGWCYITPDIARQIVEMAGALLMPPPVEVPPGQRSRNPILDNYTQPAAPDADEAAADAMSAAYKRMCIVDVAECHQKAHANGIRAILTAIRSGAIRLPEDTPQIATLRAKMAEAETLYVATANERDRARAGIEVANAGRGAAAEEYRRQIAEMSAKLAAYESDAAAAAGELRISVKDCGPGTLAGKLLSANVLLRHGNGDILSRAVDAEADRDRLAAQVAELTRELDARKGEAGYEKKLRAMACAELLKACQSAGCVPLSNDMITDAATSIGQCIDALKAELAAANEACAEKQAAIEKFLCGEQAADAEIARLKNEIADSRMRWEQRAQDDKFKIEKLGRDLAGERAEHDATKDWGHVEEGKVEKLTADLAAVTERAEKAEAATICAEGSKVIIKTDINKQIELAKERNAARAEADALRGEVEALRRYGNRECTAMADAEIARRAAGVEVE